MGIVSSFLLILTFHISAWASIEFPNKIGIGTWEPDSKGTALKHVEALKFGWYYNWRTDPLWTPGYVKRRVEFVPMIWGRDKMNSAIPSQSKFLLGFNEPDHRDQSNMSVAEALGLWPKLLSKKLRLGSPATTTEGAVGSSSWLGQFMNQAANKKYRVDFVALHYYSNDKSIPKFRQYLQTAYATYKKPIWVTEWALVDWNNPTRFTTQEIADFAEAALEMMDDLSFVERHAYFSAYAYSNYGSIRTELFDSQMRLTNVGKVFQKALSLHLAPLKSGEVFYEKTGQKRTIDPLRSGRSGPICHSPEKAGYDSSSCGGISAHAKIGDR